MNILKLKKNKYGLQLRDYNSYADYKKATRAASMRLYYSKNKEKVLKRCAEYQKTEIGKKNHNNRAKKFYNKRKAAYHTLIGPKAPEKIHMEQ